MDDPTPDPGEQADGPFLTEWVRRYGRRPLDFDACWACQKERSPGGVGLGPYGPPGTLHLCGQHTYGPDAVDWRPILDEARRSRLPAPTGAYLRVFTRHYGAPADLNACWVCGGSGLWLSEISIPPTLGPPARAWFCDEHQSTVPLNVLQYEAEQALLPAPRGQSPEVGASLPPCCVQGPCAWITGLKERLRDWYKNHPRREPSKLPFRQNYSDRHFRRKLTDHGFTGRWPPPESWAKQ